MEANTTSAAFESRWSVADSVPSAAPTRNAARLESDTARFGGAVFEREKNRSTTCSLDLTERAEAQGSPVTLMFSRAATC